ncbi:hypothetical protein [Geodermatophilus sp. DSM 45219]|uniref:hypothetical protein n=1 Tax=Geodermatophilus sp. DSM 45219 TaxID=1881103 RepID=UPI0008838557|nr:hypothetical protein [Geodermatophilus sp. DSM 45219]SDN80507.1 Cu/Zn superoxide dismutase [Geodermatophilus sp. DSM 45219]
MRRTLLPAAAVLLALTSCASHEEDGLREDLAAVTAEDQVASEELAVAGEEPLVPVEVTADLVDPEGSTVGTAWMRDTDNGSELELRVSGLTPGTHPVTVHAVGTCDPAQGFAAVGDVVAELPGVLVLDGGVGTLTTLVGPEPLEDLLAGDGVAAVVQESEGAAAPPVATRVACAAFTG